MYFSSGFASNFGVYVFYGKSGRGSSCTGFDTTGAIFTGFSPDYYLTWKLNLYFISSGTSSYVYLFVFNG